AIYAQNEISHGNAIEKLKREIQDQKREIEKQKSEIEIYRKAVKTNTQRETHTSIVIRRLWEKVVELYGDSDHDSLAEFITECYQ
ncbi:MAG: hypothetical protein ACRC6O_08730, partial [Flavobacterium sp.]